MSANADRKKRARRITAKKAAAAGNWRTLIRRAIRNDIALWRAFDRHRRRAHEHAALTANPLYTTWFPVR